LNPTYHARENDPYLESSLYMPLITSPIRVLVVEDEAFTRIDAVEMLRAAGFEVVEAVNADEAIQMLERDSAIRLILSAALVS
jgi:PleD family two-component response regulator